MRCSAVEVSPPPCSRGNSSLSNREHCSAVPTKQSVVKTTASLLADTMPPRSTSAIIARRSILRRLLLVTCAAFGSPGTSYPLPFFFAVLFIFSFKRCCAAVAERPLCQSAQACGAHVLQGVGAAWEAALSPGAVGAGAVLMTGLRRVSSYFLFIFSLLFRLPHLSHSPFFCLPPAARDTINKCPILAKARGSLWCQR